MPHERRRTHLESLLERAAQDAIAAYNHTHRISPLHPAETSVYVIPTTYLARAIAEQLARADDGSLYHRADVEIFFDVSQGGWVWRLEIALNVARAPTPDAPFRQRRRVLAAVSCEKPDIEVEEAHTSILAFGQTLPAMLLALANGQWPVSAN